MGMSSRLDLDTAVPDTPYDLSNGGHSKQIAVDIVQDVETLLASVLCLYRMWAAGWSVTSDFAISEQSTPYCGIKDNSRQIGIFKSP
jgi:hypothetical protein